MILYFGLRTFNFVTTVDSKSFVNDSSDDWLNLDIKENNHSNGINDETDNVLSFICPDCESGFRSKGSLKTHQQYKHEGVTYSCNICHYKASHKSNLRKHKKSKHEGVTYSCN